MFPFVHCLRIIFVNDSRACKCSSSFWVKSAYYLLFSFPLKQNLSIVGLILFWEMPPLQNLCIYMISLIGDTYERSLLLKKKFVQVALTLGALTKEWFIVQQKDTCSVSRGLIVSNFYHGSCCLNMNMDNHSTW
jgi:hypothetical protein